MTQTPKLGAIAIVLRADQALLVQRAKDPGKGLWGFPGGHVELGETALQAAVRELHEETGVIADPVDYLTNVDVIARADDGSIAHHYLLAAVNCAYVEGEPVAMDDAADARWWDITDIQNGHVECTKRVLDVLNAALNAR